MKCALINIDVVLFLRCRSHNKVTFSASKIVPSLHTSLLELNTSVIHGARYVKGIVASKCLVNLNQFETCCEGNNLKAY